MGFFAEFNTWLNGVLAQYIATNTAAIARLLEPAIVTLGVFYVVIWGYLQLVGKIEEPFTEGVKRLLTLALILGLSLDLWLYTDVIVDTFFNAPTTLAGGIIAAASPGGAVFDPVGVVDEIFFDGDDAASLLMQKGEIFGRDIVFYFAAVAVYIVVGITAVYTMFLLALSKIALSVLIAMGPIFMALLFFESTKKFFEAWIAQLSNYAFLTILVVLVAALMLHVVTVAAQEGVGMIGWRRRARAARENVVSQERLYELVNHTLMENFGPLGSFAITHRTASDTDDIFHTALAASVARDIVATLGEHGIVVQSTTRVASPMPLAPVERVVVPRDLARAVSALSGPAPVTAPVAVQADADPRDDDALRALVAHHQEVTQAVEQKRAETIAS